MNFNITRAVDGGYIVVDTSHIGLTAQILFAGDLDACLTYIKRNFCGENKRTSDDRTYIAVMRDSNTNKLFALMDNADSSLVEYKNESAACDAAKGMRLCTGFKSAAVAILIG